MELTKLTHKLTIGGVAYVIDEPIGFDGLKTKISRGNYHGISAEVSAGKLEFYDNAGRNAASIIRDAYNTDIDTEITYTVADDSGELLYSGVIDLSTYSETNANATKVSVNVGEVGIKTTFNNRTDTEVDLNRSDTMDGSPLAHNPAWKNLLIPARTIQYKNIMEQPETVVYDKNFAGDDLVFEDDASNNYVLGLSLEKNRLNEFGTFEPKIYCATLPYNGIVLDGYIEPLFSKGSDFAEKYGADSTYNIEVHLRVRMKFNGDIVTPRTSTPYFQFSLGLFKSQMGSGSFASGTMRYVSNDGGRYSEGSGSYNTRDTDDCHDSLLYELDTYLTDCDAEKMFLAFWCHNSNDHYNNPSTFTLEIEQGSYVRMTLNSKKKTTVNADMMMIHEALNKVSEIISDNKLQVKSDWYSRFDSVVFPKENAPYNSNPTAFLNSIGGGALKAITNGYKIRNLYTDGETERNMPMSFKNLIEALDALDCIGWGIVEENGELYIRVERWFWFYQNDVILTINEPNEKTRNFLNEMAITTLKIGYKKYTTNEDYNTNDNFHSERTFTSNTSAIAKEVSKLCAFIADNYSIEATRRAKDDVDASEEFKYDENIFIFGLKCARNKNTTSGTYSVPNDIDTDENINLNYPSEFFNALLSPARCAVRWIQRIFCINGLKPLKLTSGTVNYHAAFTTKHDGISGNFRNFYLQDSFEDIPLKGFIWIDEQDSDAWQEIQAMEDMDICERYFTLNRNGVDIPQDNDKIYPRIAKAETLKVKYPLTLNQYKAIKANPYGLIVVDGEKCWLKEMQYEFKTGLTELTLIPKYEQ